jgi:anthraniloyl-CoA monooxygenase
VNVAVIGGGPAGLYAALLLKKWEARHEVTVFERNPPDATFGWGVVFSEETLEKLADADYDSYLEITENFTRWTSIDIHFGGQRVRSRGHAFSGIARRRLLEILQGRCREVGVDLRFQQTVEDLAPFQGCELVIGADGINGIVRRCLAAQLHPELRVHSTKYAWFGTDLPLDTFTFIFRRNQHGLFQVHAYPFDARLSTFIVECPQEAWEAAGLDRMDEAESLAYCERLFEAELEAHRLLSNRSVWINFATLRTDSWHHGKFVLVGDAAHTAHFSIGSGTKLAIEDSIALVDALRRRPDLEAAFADYELERQPVVERFQEAALESSSYFEHVSRYEKFEPLQFAFNLLTRSRRITHANLRARDPELTRRVDAWFFGTVTGSSPALAPPPMFAPFRLRDDELANRVVIAGPFDDDAVEGTPGRSIISSLVQAARSGAGLIVTSLVAVSPQGRITPASPALYADAHAAAWRWAVEAVREAGVARIGLQLGHAGRRGSVRPRREGMDRPLREGGWPLIAASPLPYTKRGQVPRAMTARDIEEVIHQFARAAELAVRCGVDLLELNFGQGYLVGTFLSPLTNQRQDDFGGSREQRARFAVSVLDVVRARWPGPLAVRISASDRSSGGWTLDDSVWLAGLLKNHGCDLVHPVSGQTVAEDQPDFGRLYGVAAADRIRNEAAIPVISSGNITTEDEVNTILAAGRADLCALDLDA